MDALRQDLRVTLRALRRAPAFVAIVVLTLGLGIGANAAIFSLLDQALLRSLPVRDPDRLVLLDGPGAFMGRTFNDQTFSYPMYRDFRDRNTVFSGVLARFPASLTLTWHGQAERVEGELVSGNYFDVLGMRPALGRLFTPQDDVTPGAHPVVVLSHGFWTRRFGNDPGVLNRVLSLNGHQMTVVGVGPAGFTGITAGSAADVMVPITMKALMTPTWDDLENRRSRWLNVVARLKPGVTAREAEAAMNVLYRQINEAELKDVPNATENFRKRFVSKRLEVLPGGRGVNRDFSEQVGTPLVVLMAMVGVVLFIACANVANLLMTRGVARQKEVAIRMALGAGRLRVLRQRLVESVVLSAAGGVAGLALAVWTGRLLIAALPFQNASRILSADVSPRLLLFTLAASLLTALVFGLAPAWHASRADVVHVIKEEAGTTTGGVHRSRLRRGLVVGQVALSVVLLAGAVLFARSLYNLRTLDPGFRVEQLLTFSVDPSLSGYDGTRSRQVYERLRRDIRALPGIRGVSMAELPVLTGSSWRSTVRVDGYKHREDEDMNPGINGVGPGFFSTMGIPLVLGREFTEHDTADAPKVAIVNETMARYFFGTSNPIGRRFGMGRTNPTDIEIVGVVRDSKSATLREEIPRMAYLPYTQSEDLGAMTFYVRTGPEAAGAASAVRDVVRRVDPGVPVYDMRRMEAQVDESLAAERLVAALSVAFGALATLLAAIGLYGVMSYAVTCRTREIGIRVALGAARGNVLWLVLREVAVLAGVGLAVGVPVALGLSRLVRSQLFGLSPADPLSLAAAASLLAIVALAAGYVPARRAARVDPLRALRYE